jgi:anti-sigma-K factor RskA
MMTMKDNAPERDEIEALLPWHAAGTLKPRDAARVERALGEDAELARRFNLVREELGETIHLNETLGAPSSRAFETLFAAIEKEAPAKRQVKFDFAGRLSEFLGQFSPRTLAWSASAAVLAIVLQAGLIAGLYVGERGGMNLASVEETIPAAQGSFVLVRFHPAATADAITMFLDANKATIADGPKSGLYRLRVSPTRLSKDKLAEVVTRFQRETAVVGSILPME